MKKTFSILLAALLALSTLVGCAAAESADPTAALTVGYYSNGFSAEGYGDFVNFIRFYPEAPTLGAVFYAGFANNGVKLAGTYVIEPVEYAYNVSADRDAALAGAMTEGVAPYTITLIGFGGEAIGQAGFDGEILYNNAAGLTAPTAGNDMFYHDVDASKYPVAYGGELGVAYLDFVNPDDESGTLTLYHNQTYLDLVNMLIEGVWSMAGGGQYTLTPLDSSDIGATLTVSADKASATYTPDDESDPVSLINTATSGPQAAFAFIGVQPIAAYGADAGLTLTLFDDGSASIEIDLFGSKQVIDQGTYEKVNDYTFGVTFDKAGYIESAIDFATTVITLQYVGEVENLGEVDSQLTLQKTE